MKKTKLWINALVLASCLLLGSGQASVYGAAQNAAQAPADPNAAAADPNAAAADPNAASDDPNVPADAAEAPKDPNAPPDSYNWEVQSDALPGWPTGPQVAAETAILMDAETGEILYAKGIDEKRYPASTTKIMTALIAIENSALTDQVTFSAEAVNGIEPGSTHIGIKPREILTMEQSLYAILLASANEVSSGVAEFVGGSIPDFVNMMNARAEKLGCKNTHFVNANGLHDPEHYTTARDLANIAREAFKNETFRKIIGTEYYIEPKTNITDEERWLNNHHKMLVSGDMHYDGCLGGKTGYTSDAGNSLVTYAQRNGMYLISVVLADNAVYQYPDTAALLDYGFSNFHKVVLAQKGEVECLKPLPIEHYLYNLTKAKTMTRFTDTATADLPTDLPVEKLTRKTSLEKKIQTTEYYLGEQLLSTSHAEVCPTLTLPEFLDAVKDSPANTANTAGAAAQNNTADSASAERTPKTSSSSLGEFFQELKYNFRNMPTWKYPALIFLLSAVIFYIVLLIIKIKRHRKKKARNKKKKK